MGTLTSIDDQDEMQQNGVFLSRSALSVEIKKMFKRHVDVHRNLGRVVTKPVFGVPDKARLNPVSSATETSWKIEMSPVASLHMILSIKRITKALIRLRGCAGWSAPVMFANPRRQVFSRRGPFGNFLT